MQNKKAVGGVDGAGNHHIHKHKQSHKRYFYQKWETDICSNTVDACWSSDDPQLNSNVSFFSFCNCSSPPTHPNTISAPHMIFVMGFDMQHIYFFFFFQKSEGNILLRRTPELLLMTNTSETADKNGVLQLYIVFQQWMLYKTTR